ncbi:MAG TPA: hypothetical protein VKV36_02565, partial [Acidimicrobiales bacterium]|nr:hypothetical protein [Acidimicrobiales bacterium]
MTVKPITERTRSPEVVAAMTLSACSHDPVPVLVTALTQAAGSGRLHLGDVLADSGYAHRVPSHFALPLRAAGADLVVDVHPQDRGPQGTHGGAICHNGNLYCPAVAGKLRCPLRPASMALDSTRPEILAPPEHPPTCCTQVTITVPPS